MSANQNPVMMALKTAIVQGTKFSLEQDATDPHSVTLTIMGGVSKTSLSLPFNWINSSDKAGENPVSGFKWTSNTYTAGLLVSAVEGMPDEADPQFLVNMHLWENGGLILNGEWTKKHARAKEGTPQHRNFLVDCGVLDV